MPDVLFEALAGKSGSIGLITLSRPQALNALTLEMCQGVEQQLNLWQHDGSIKAVVIRGEGDRAFCAGGDVRQVYAARGTDYCRDFFASEYRMNRRIFHFPKPYIALMDGITMGGGLGIGIHGSHGLVTERSLLAMPECSIGLFPDVGVGYPLSRQGPLGRYLSLTGYKMSSSDAIFSKLARFQVAAKQLDDFLGALREIHWDHQPHERVQEVCLSFCQPPGPSALETSLSKIKEAFHHATLNDIFQTLAEDSNDWAQKTLALLNTMAPTSLAVTLEQLSQYAHFSFDACIITDFRLSQKFMHDSDFFEGIRSKLIEKTNRPQWQPEQIDDSSLPQKVEDYFLPIANELAFNED